MPRSHRAFTVLELLVVLAIIGTVIAMLVPVVQNTRRDAHQTACISNLRQLGQAARMYMTDNENEDYLPARLEPIDTPYIKAPQIFICKQDTTDTGYAHSIFGTGRPYGKRVSYGYVGKAFKDPSDLELTKRSNFALFCDTLHGTDKPVEGWHTAQEFSVDGSFVSPPNFIPIYEGKCLRVMQDGHIATSTFHILHHADGQTSSWDLLSALTHKP